MSNKDFKLRHRFDKYSAIHICSKRPLAKSNGLVFLHLPADKGRRAYACDQEVVMRSDVFVKCGAPTIRPLTIPPGLSKFDGKCRRVIHSAASETCESFESLGTRNFLLHCGLPIFRNRAGSCCRCSPLVEPHHCQWTLETQILRPFPDDLMTRVGSGTYVLEPTYGVLASGVRTSTIGMDKSEETYDSIL